MNFSENDLKQIKDNELDLNTIEQQIQLFKTGIPFTKIAAAATIGNGILKLYDTQIEHYQQLFEAKKNDYDLLKFVPASGAATRMFKFLFQFLQEFNPYNHTIQEYIEASGNQNISKFTDDLKQFPFYKLVLEKSKEIGIDFDKLSKSEKICQFVKLMLDEDKLNYGNFPKGLLPFHYYSDNDITTAFEEHLYEAALYASSDKKATLHFTISEEYKTDFENVFNSIKTKVEELTGVSFEISYSYQQSSTDTIAVTPDNTPFRTETGNLLFRPSGHGALLQNLNAIDSDIVFIKNIDNVVVQGYRQSIAKYKKILAGLLIEVRTKAFTYLRQLDEEQCSEDHIKAIATFLSKELNTKTPKDFNTWSLSDKAACLHKLLNRPIRICGMVKNEGEPGGGPFWIVDNEGNQSLQIVESAQIDLDDDQQSKLFEKATHFNPVDLVCGVKDYEGKAFNLQDFVNPNAAFITNKTQAGKDLKALELPGLWNGSMAYWNTVFVEVPIITFNPVKTVNDLLKPAHQVK